MFVHYIQTERDIIKVNWINSNTMYAYTLLNRYKKNIVHTLTVNKTLKFIFDMYSIVYRKKQSKFKTKTLIKRMAVVTRSIYEMEMTIFMR